MPALLALSLVKAGFQVTVISPGKRTLSRYENVDGVHVYRFLAPPAGNGLTGYLWEYGWSLFSSFYLTLWVFLRRGFDVIHAHNPPDLFVLIACRPPDSGHSLDKRPPEQVLFGKYLPQFRRVAIIIVR